MIPDEQYQVQLVLDRMGQRSLAFAKQAVFAEGTAKDKSVFVSYSTGSGNGGGYRVEPSVSVKGLYRAKMRGNARNKADRDGGDITDIHRNS